MSDLLQSPGFLGTKAQFGSDATLVLILISAMLFTIGWRLAVGKHYGPHRWVQTASATLNAIIVVGVMIGSFLAHILPGIPTKLAEGSYGVTTVHAFVGLIGLLLGVFVVLRANKLVPRALRFANYKPFMRVSYALYMAATLIGVVVYVEAFVYGI